MKLEVIKKLATGAYGLFKFPVGKGSIIRHIILAGDWDLDVNAESFIISGSYKEVLTNPTIYEDLFLRDRLYCSISSEHSFIDSNRKHYDMRDLEVEAIMPDIYIGLQNDLGQTHAFSITVLYDKPFKNYTK